MGRVYTQEFKHQIVALHRRDGRTFGEIATEFGLSATSVAKWVREAEKRDKPGRAAAGEERTGPLTLRGQRNWNASWRRRPKKWRSWESAGLLRSTFGAVELHRYMAAEKAKKPTLIIRVICRLLGVASSGYYGWLARSQAPPRGRAAEDRELVAQIRLLHGRFS